MFFEVFMSAASPVGVLEAERVACSSGYKLSQASLRRGVFARIQKNKNEDEVGAGGLKVCRQLLARFCSHSSTRVGCA